MRVFDDARARGRRRASRSARRRRGAQVAVGLRPGLARGGYTATYRVISADSHPVSGGFVFTVGDARRARRRPSTSCCGAATPGPVTATAFAVVRAVQYGAIAIALGGARVPAVGWRRRSRMRAGGGAATAAFSRGLRRLLVVAARRGAASARVAGDRAAGRDRAAARASGRRSTRTCSTTCSATRFGGVWALGACSRGCRGARSARCVVAAAARAAAAARSRSPACPRSAATRASQPPVVAQRARQRRPRAAPMSAWLGGIAVLVLVAARRHPRARAGTSARRVLAAASARFSPLRRRAIAAVLATGVAAGDHRDAELRPAARHRVRARGADQARAARRARRPRRGQPPRAAARACARAAATPPAPPACCCGGRCTPRSRSRSVVLGATGALAGYPPPTPSRPGPFSTDPRSAPRAWR